jgi:hypothetical protein
MYPIFARDSNTVFWTGRKGSCDTVTTGWETEARVSEKESDVVSGGERRHQPRYAVSCRCWIEQDAMTLFGTVTNMSSGGLFLRTLPIVHEGSGVDVRLSLENGVVTGRGAVRWRTQPSGGGTSGPFVAPGLGIELVSVTSGEELLEKFITRRSLVPLPEF